MPYQLGISKSVTKYIEKLHSDIYRRIKEAIVKLENYPHEQGIEKMTKMNAYRIRVGDYRIIYTIKDSILLVEVIDAGHRRESYRK